MKTIGVLFGMESTFPQAFIEEANKQGDKNIHAEPVSIDQVKQGKSTG